jgi:hypothetical protein
MNARVTAFCRFGIGVVLAGCSTQQLPATVGAGAMPSARAVAKTGHVKSWMLDEAKTEKLIYLSDMTKNAIFVLSYRTGKTVGVLSGPSETAGLCSDAHGNVYVTGDNEIVEYAHGGAAPVASFSSSGTEFSDCAVDPTTGNLAAAMFDKPSVAIFRSANTVPVVVPLHKGVSGSCAYDIDGDLIVDEGNSYYGISLEELPAKKNSFVTLATGISSMLGHVQWHQGSLLLNVPNIQQFRIEGMQARQVGVVGLQGGSTLRDMGDAQFVVQNGVAIVPYSFDNDFGMEPALLGIWKYPSGLFLKSYHGDFGRDLLDGVAISSSST